MTGMISTKLRQSAKGQPCTLMIPGFSRYRVDREGNVFGPSGPIKRRTDRKGYLRVQIYDDAGRCRNATVHRLVALTFIPNPLRLPQVNHIDENKQNPRVENLEWCDASHNIRHSRARSDAVVDPDGIVHEFECLADFVAEFGLCQSGISAVLNGGSPHHRGWRPATRENIGVPYQGRVRQSPFQIVGPDGQIVSGNNTRATAEELGLDRIGLNRLILGRISTHRGWRVCR